MTVFQWVLDNPNEVFKELASKLPTFKKVYKSPTKDHYIQGLVDSLKSMGISATPSPSEPKCRFTDIHDSSESEDEPPRNKSKKSKKKKKKAKKDLKFLRKIESVSFQDQYYAMYVYSLIHDGYQRFCYFSYFTLSH